RARIIGDAAAPEVVIAVTASQTADLRALHQRIETEALSHVRHAVSNTRLPLLAAHRKAGTLDRRVDCRESYAGVIVVMKPLVLSSSAGRVMVEHPGRRASPPGVHRLRPRPRTCGFP